MDDSIMPSNRQKKTRAPAEEFSDELIDWIQGRIPFPIAAYFLMPYQLDRLTTKHGNGAEPRRPGDRDD